MALFWHHWPSTVTKTVTKTKKELQQIAETLVITGGAYWFRTSGLLNVNQALSH